MEADSELVHSYLSGEHSAMDVLIMRHTSAIYAYVSRLTGDREAAADITQETFVKVWKNLARFREGENFKTWIFAIARNSAFDWLRKRKHIPFSVLESDDFSFADIIRDDEALPDEVFERREMGTYAEELLAKLSPENRDILLLHYVDEMTFDEIGKLLGASLNTVKSRHRRALLALRSKVTPAPKTR